MCLWISFVLTAPQSTQLIRHAIAVRFITRHRRLLRPPRLLQWPLPRCRHERGVQLRKLYEPELFLAKNTRDQSIPQAMLAGFMHEMRATMQLMNESFGPTPRCGVCAIGVEPNPSHYDHLKQVTRNLRAMGYAAYVVFAAASTAAGTAQLGNRDQSRFAGGLNSPSLGLAANILPSRGSQRSIRMQERRRTRQQSQCQRLISRI